MSDHSKEMDRSRTNAEMLLQAVTVGRPVSQESKNPWPVRFLARVNTHRYGNDPLERVMNSSRTGEQPCEASGS